MKSKFPQRGLLFAHLIEPTHVGAAEGTGVVDRVVFRESTTGFPTIPGSSLKGALRAAMHGWEDEAIRHAAFGAPGVAGKRGCILLSDLRLLFLPARSLAGTFAWVTAPLPLARFERCCRLIAETDQGNSADGAVLPGFDQLINLPNSAAIALSPGTLQITRDGVVVVEGLTFNNVKQASSEFLAGLIKTLFGASDYWQRFLLDRVLVVSDDDFAHLCKETLPVEANIAMEPDRGVTAEGSLRYSEYLPAETLLYAPMTFMEPVIGSQRDGRDFVVESWAEAMPKALQLGADESKGKGVAQLSYLDARGLAEAAVDSKYGAASE